jgi:hypothetical protein
MTLTQNGINFILQKFGDTNYCCVNTGLIITYTDIEGNTYTNQTVGTPFIVGILASSLAVEITMVMPSRGTITALQMHNANGSTVTLYDADELKYHDEPGDTGGAMTPVGQWCYGGGTNCTNPDGPIGSEACIDGYWNTCSSGKQWVPNTPAEPCAACSSYLTKPTCEAGGCYWYSDFPFMQEYCHSKKEDPMNKYLIYGGIALVGLAIVVTILKRRQ